MNDKICEHWRPPYSKHELGSGDWVETPREKWQNRSRPFNMNYKHVKTTWTINKWKKCHYRSLQHDFWEQFSKHELHSGDWVQIAKRWLFFLFFLCFFRFSFFSSFFSWVSRQWDNLHLVFNWENVSWGQFFFLFFSFVWSFLTKKCKKGNHIRAARVFLAPCAAENSTILCALVAFWIPESCVVSCCALSFQFQRSPMSSSANGPLARTAKRHREVDPMMAGMNPFLASMFGPAFALLVPTRAESCWLCFDGSMRYVATRDQKRHWFLMCLFCQLLSDRVASVVKTKSVLIGFSLNRLNRMK